MIATEQDLLDEFEKTPLPKSRLYIPVVTSWIIFILVSLLNSFFDLKRMQYIGFNASAFQFSVAVVFPLIGLIFFMLKWKAGWSMLTAYAVLLFLAMLSVIDSSRTLSGEITTPGQGQLFVIIISGLNVIMLQTNALRQRYKVGPWTWGASVFFPALFAATMHFT